MAKWKFGNQQAGAKATFEYESGSSTGESTWSFEQDERPFLEQAKIDRERGTLDNNSSMRKFATIPEIVAIEIKDKYGVDLHHPDFMQDIDQKAKFFSIIRSDYSYLVVNND